MFRQQKSGAGFTMVELLIVLIIVGILAAVATPLYLTNVKRARASEAVGAMGLIRQALRDHKIKANNYFDVAANGTTGNIQLAPTTGLNVDVGVSKYFSNSAYTVDIDDAGTQGEENKFQNPNAVDFIIYATGSPDAPSGNYGQNNLCSGNVNNCATNATEVKDYRLQMDNSGRVFVAYGEKDSNNKLIWEAY